MANKRKKVFRLIFGWQEEKEEKWLKEMAEKGWLLKSYNLGLYTFVEGEPGKYIYKFDYKATSNKDLYEYIKIFEDAGWEHVTQYTGWHYFRTKDDGSTLPELYSDNNSKIQRYKDQLKVIAILFAINVLNLLNLSFNHWKANDSHNFGTKNIPFILIILAVGLLGYFCFRLLQKIKELKTEI